MTRFAGLGSRVLAVLADAGLLVACWLVLLVARALPSYDVEAAKLLIQRIKSFLARL